MAVDDTAAANGALERGRLAYQAKHRAAPYELLAVADDATQLPPADLELLRNAAQMTGRDPVGDVAARIRGADGHGQR